MASNVTKVSIIPDPSIIGKLGKRSKNISETIAELIDNSLDAFIQLPTSLQNGKDLEVTVEVTDQVVTIQDNAKGMNAKELGMALKVASSNKSTNKDMIGTYGFGLKSASMFLADRLEIYSIHHNEPTKVNYLNFDRKAFEKKADEISKKEKNTLSAIEQTWSVEVQTLSISQASDKAHFNHRRGTKIILHHGGKIRAGNKEVIQKKLKQIFAPLLTPSENSPTTKSIYLKNFSMRLFWKDVKGKIEELFAAGPFYDVRLDSDGTPMKKSDLSSKGKLNNEPVVLPFKMGVTYVDIPVIKINGKRVFGRAGLLDRSQYHDGNYGFDLIKNGRVIEFNVIEPRIGKRPDGTPSVFFTKSSDKARIVGQLHLDDWEADHQKTQILRTSEGWHELTKHVEKHVAQLYTMSTKLQNAGFKKESAKKAKIFSPLDLDNKKIKKIVTDLAKSNNKNLRTASIEEIHNLSIKIRSSEQTNENAFSFKSRSLKNGSEISITLFLKHKTFSMENQLELNQASKFIQITCIVAFLSQILKVDFTHNQLIELENKLLNSLSH